MKQDFAKLRVVRRSSHHLEESIVRSQDQPWLTTDNFYVTDHLDKVLDELTDSRLGQPRIPQAYDCQQYVEQVDVGHMTTDFPEGTHLEPAQAQVLFVIPMEDFHRPPI